MSFFWSFDDVLLTPKYSDIASRKDVDVSVEMGPYKLRVPIISAPMDTITGHAMAIKMADLGGLGIIHRFNSIQEQLAEFQTAAYTCRDPRDPVELTRNIGIAVGLHDLEERVSRLHSAGARIFCLDLAHGHSKAAGEAVKKLREFKDAYVIAGNVATYEGAQYLFDLGAQAIRVGIGGGSACRTRMATGIGVPLFTAIQDCRKSKAFLIADGGIRGSNDVVKAMAIGANACMIGGLLAGCDETPGEVIEDRGTNILLGGMIPSAPGPLLGRYKKFRGMASKEAEQDFKGEVGDWKTAEGVSTTVPCKGPAEGVIKDLMGGLRSGMTYIGARNTKELINSEKANFIVITQNGYIEGTPHVL